MMLNLTHNMRWVQLFIGLQLVSHVLWANRCPKTKADDMFPCSPCNCSHMSMSRIRATCTSPEIHLLPKGLPRNTWNLTVSKTQIKSLGTEDFLQYLDLNVLTVSKNSKLRKIIGRAVFNQTTKVVFVDLSWNRIGMIDDGSFALMPLAHKLSLSHNLIKKISNSTFKGLSHVRELDLSVNKIKSIEHGAFDHMTLLKILNLSRNRYLGYGPQQLSPRLFLKLKVLNTLFIQSSSNGAKEYPNEALQQLKNLKTLGIDGLSHGAEFDPGMKSLKYLKELQLGSLGNKGTCYILNISSTFFDSLPYLESFKVAKCRLQHLDLEAFASLNSLKTYSLIALPHYDLYTALDELEALVNSSVTSLGLVNLDIRRSLCRCLGEQEAKYLQYMKLRVLDMSYNRLAYIGRDFAKKLPASLEKLVLKGNKLTVITYILKKLLHLDNLTELDIGNQGVDYPGTYQSNRNKLSLGSAKNSTRALEKTLPLTGRSLCDRDIGYNFLGDKMEGEISNDIHQGDYYGSKPYYLSLPEKLHTLRASGFKRFGYSILKSNLGRKNNSLREIYFDNSYLGKWGSGKMPVGIKRASLNGNYCEKINRDFFPPNNSLQYLSLKNNYLGDVFEQDHNGTIFSELNITVYLDLSRNLIFFLHTSFLKGLVQLRTLKLSDNKIQNLRTSFSHMTSLTYLDLSKNSIIWISKSVREDLDKIAFRPGHQLKIDLTSNQLPCTCAGLEILIWMANSNICFLNADFLECRFENDNIGLMGNLTDRVESLQRHCLSKGLIIVTCVTPISFLGVLVILGLLYQNRWKLRYWKYVTMAKKFGFNPREKGEEDYKFDAYIVYTDVTTKFVLKECVQELEEKRGHKLCIEDREYLPGTDILGSIVSAVQNSRKTIPIVTPDFYQHDFSEFRIKMAMMEEVYKSRSVLHLCVYQPVPEDEMSDDFLTVMKRNSYIEFPPEDHMSEEIRQTFWDQLSDVIGHTEGENVEPLLDL